MNTKTINHFLSNNLFFFLTLIIICSCEKKDTCGNTVNYTGIYENKYIEGATNYLILYDDGTFVQEYKKNNIEKINKGSWEYYNRENYCSIKFKNLKLLHKVPHEYFKLDSVINFIPIFRNNKIMFVEDLPFEYDFVKTDLTTEEL